MIQVFHDMGQTCLIRRSCRPDVQCALNSGPVCQHRHVLKTDHNYASCLKLIEEDNKQAVLFQAPTWLPQADTNKNTSPFPLSIPRALILWCGEETGSSAGTSMDSKGGSHDPVSVNNVTRRLPDNRKCCRRICLRHWEIA